MITYLSLCLFLVAWPPLLEAKAVSQQDHVKDAASESQSASHFLQIARKSCLSADGRPGTCMFNFQCQQLRGQVVAPCLDGFLFGACCHLSDDKAIASVITSAVQAAGIRPSVSLPYVSPVSLSWRDELSTSSFDADELLLDVDASAASVRQPGLEDSALFNSNVDSSLDSGEDWTEQPERIEETTIRIPAEAGPDDKPHSDIEAIEVSQPVSNQISSVDDRLFESVDSAAGIISSGAAQTQLASTTTTQSTVQETTTTAPTSSAAIQTTRSPVSGKPTSTVHHPVNILQYLVSNPPAWVIQELLNGTSSPANLQDVVDSLESSSVEEPSTTSAIPATTEATTTTRKPQPVFDYNKHCGVRPLVRKSRIVGGRRSDYGKWPWQVLIRESTWFFRSKKKCGGVLISDRHVLTAAHCRPGLFSSLMVVLGEFDVSGGSEPHTPVEKNVKRVVVHKDYVERTFENDLAILELETPVEFRPYIVPICLPSTSDGDFHGQKADVTGWGRLSHNGPTPPVLHEVDVPILTNKECHDMFRKSGHEKRILDSFVCAGYKDGKKDACEGDSGGPMMLERDDGRWTLVGTVSNGIGCANPNMPGIYMRMSYYRPWIERVTGLSGEQLG